MEAAFTACSEQSAQELVLAQRFAARESHTAAGFFVEDLVLQDRFQDLAYAQLLADDLAR
jgi:hypothetical protein